MQRFGLDDLAGLAPRWDAAVDRTQGADPFCASSDWSFPAAAAFRDASEPIVTAARDGLCGMRSVRQSDGSRVLVGLDPVWGFATPVVGPPLDAAAALAERLRIERWDYALIAGQSIGFDGTRAIVGALGELRALQGPVQERLRADLTDGFDTWWARRSSRFRQRLRRVEREATEQGIEIEDASSAPADEALDRILRVEATSWKADEETGLNSPDMAVFYRGMAHRLAPEGRLRVLFARRDGVDIGYVLGGVRGATYRGLQLSYASTVAGQSVGHLLQLAQLRRLGPEIDTYDLGMDMPYKRRWIDRIDETMSIIVVR